MMSITARKVETKAEFEVFFRFPWKLYKNDPVWVPELPSMRRNTLDKHKHAAWEYLEGDYFVAWRDSEAVGTIAAFVNHRHNQQHHQNIGFFGFFECINDQAAANALFQAAEEYLRAKGVTAIRGPASFTSNELYGLLIENFTLPPMILMPYNPPYYVQLVENYGFQKAMDLYSWRSEFSDAPANVYEADGVTENRLVKAIRRSMERRNITVRSFDSKNKAAEFKLILSLYHAAWENNWGFVSMTDRELDNMVRDLSFLLDPKYTFFAYVKGEPVGFLMMIPNFNDVLKHVNARPGVPEIWWLLKALWHWKIRPKLKSMRVILMGVKEGYRKIGVDAAMQLALAEQMIKDQNKGYEWAEGSWVLEINEDTNRLLEHFGSKLHRKHRIYEKAL